MVIRQRAVQSGKYLGKLARRLFSSARWTETILLSVGLAATIYAKATVFCEQDVPVPFYLLAHLLLPDLLFFAAVALVIRLLYLIKPSALTARLALVITSVVALWSLFNMVWLLKSGVQLQPGIAVLFVRDLRHFWPLILERAAGSPLMIVLASVLVIGIAGVLSWRFVRPEKVAVLRAHHAHAAIFLASAIVLLSVAHFLFPPQSSTNMVHEMLSYSSHWQALASIKPDYQDTNGTLPTLRNLPRAGERTVSAPPDPDHPKPNIIIILLESVPHSATSLAAPDADHTPHLAALAREGMQFQTARVPVSHTTKAIWAALTASTPVINADYVEAVPVSRPYESLVTILKKTGYRSAFFEMSKGSFETAAALCHNLGFDWAWFRENLEDPSSHLGYLSGDDLRMVEPIFNWISLEPQPFFVMTITSVAHDPFELPDRPDLEALPPQQRYFETVRYTDRFIGRICENLTRLNLDDNTLICVMGDHGTSFRSHVRKHGRWIPYEEVIRVPWVIHWPGHVEAGTKIDSPCSQMDVTPTLLSLLGFDISQAEFDGLDATKPIPADRRVYFSSWHHNSPFGFVEESRKVVFWPLVDKVFEYDLTNDPHEDNPKTILDPEAQALKDDLLTWQQASHIYFKPTRYQERFLYSHWQVFSTGQSAWSYYVP